MRLRLLLLMTLTAGCTAAPPVAKTAYSPHRFDEVETANHDRATTLTSATVEQMIGPGEEVPPTHPDIAGGPPLISHGVQTWSRWESEHEVLLVGYAGDVASSVVRLRR